MFAFLALASAAELVILPDGGVAFDRHGSVQVFDAGTGTLRYTLPAVGSRTDLSVVDGRLVVQDAGLAFTWEGARLVDVRASEPAARAPRPTCLPFAGGEVCDGTFPPADPVASGVEHGCEIDWEEPEICFAHLRRDGEDVPMPSCTVEAAGPAGVLLKGLHYLTFADARGRTLARARGEWEGYAVGDAFAVAATSRHLVRLGTDGSVHGWNPPEPEITGVTWERPPRHACVVMAKSYVGVVDCETGETAGLVPYEEWATRPGAENWHWDVRKGEAVGPTFRIGRTGWEPNAGLERLHPAASPANTTPDTEARFYRGRTAEGIDRATGNIRWSRDFGKSMIEGVPPYWVMIRDNPHRDESEPRHWQLLDWTTGRVVDAGEGLAESHRFAPPLLVARFDAETWRLRDTRTRRWVGTWATEIRALARGSDGTAWITSLRASPPWIAAVDPKGRERWRIPAPGGAVGAAAAEGKVLLVGSGDALFAIDGATGAVRWTKPWVGGARAILNLSG
jgi:hypothetical protein